MLSREINGLKYLSTFEPTVVLRIRVSVTGALFWFSNNSAHCGFSLKIPKTTYLNDVASNAGVGGLFSL